MLKWDPKDPSEVLDYDLLWDDRLDDGDTIASSSWAVPAGSVTIQSSSFSTTAAKVWLSGGVDGEDCDLKNTITTVGGRTLDQTVRLRIRSR